MKKQTEGSGGQDKTRIDKWLWAARFLKTRALAVTAVENGRALVNGERVKPAKSLAVGDMLTIKLGPYEFEVEVLALSGRRGPPAEAQKLYRETEESRARRAALAEERKAQQQYSVLRGRPTKKDRRDIEKLKTGKVW
jgi:ribosome-associated heat shock protein Hsp15